MPHGIYQKGLADRLIARSGEKWQPSNGTEGEMFFNAWCDNCERDAADMICLIMVATMAYSPGDDEYPLEWVIGDDGQPKCTAFAPIEQRAPTEKNDSQIDMFAG